jgi:chromosome segregation ATPase
MEWFFDSKGKSVASSAQKVVSDMHRHIEKQNEKIRELEQAIFKCQHICTDSLEKDIIRLEQRKRDLIAELEATDEAILDRQERLQAAREEVNRTLSHSMAG